MFQTFETSYGKITLYQNDVYIIRSFLKGKYYDLEKLLKLQKYIDPGRNILEIGGHCGTSTLVYSKFTSGKIYVYE